MRIAILIGHFPPGRFGGAELQAEQWARRLAVQHEVVVLTRRDPPTQSAEESHDGYRVIRVPCSAVPGWRTLADLWSIDRAVAAMPQPPQLLLCFQTFVSGLAGALIHERTRIPTVVWIRGEAEYQLGRSRLHRQLAPWTWRRSRAVLVQSEQNRVGLEAALRRWAPASTAPVIGRVEVIGNGVELPPEPLALGDRVLSVGRLIQDKGMDVVIRAAAAAGIPLSIAGEGPERAALEALARSLGADCRFEGHVSGKRLAQLYGEALCVVLAARIGEGLPNVVLEGMAHARAVVATPCAGTRDLLVDQDCGLLVPVDDIGALQAALVRLRDEPEFALRLGARARLRAAASSWERWHEVLEEGLQRWVTPC